MIEELVLETTPHLVKQFGIRVDTTAEILIVARDNPERIKPEAAFAKLAGVSLIPAGSFMTSAKHRIIFGGQRQRNPAMCRTVILHTCFLILTTAFLILTTAYLARRVAEEKSKGASISGLTRYVIREAYHLFKAKPIPLEIAA